VRDAHLSLEKVDRTAKSLRGCRECRGGILVLTKLFAEVAIWVSAANGQNSSQDGVLLQGPESEVAYLLN
jgi:hypothetical protein